MTRRRCWYCSTPMEWWAPLVGFRTCGDCAYRLHMGGSPLPPTPQFPGPRSGSSAAGSVPPD